MTDAPATPTPTTGQAAATKIVETVTGKTTEKFWEWVFPVLADLGIGGAFHYFGKKHLEGKLSALDKQKLEEARELHAAGKKDEARNVIQAHIGGFGFNDEYIVWSTTLRVLFAGVLTSQQRAVFCAFLKGMTARENEKFRKMFSVEKDDDLRDVNLLRFAQLPLNEMRATLRGSGTYRMTTWDHMDAGAKKLAVKLRPHYNRLQQEFFGRLSGTHNPDPTTTNQTARRREILLGKWFTFRW